MYSYSASKYKNCNSFTVTDNFGNTYLFTWTGKRWFNTAKCEVNTDGHIDENDGLVPGAVPFHPEEVADIVAQHEERQELLQKVEHLLEDWLDLQRFQSRKVKRKPKQLHKMEAVQ